MSRKIIIGIAGGVFLIISGIIVWLFTSDKVALVINDSHAQTVTAKVICSETTVDTFNQASEYKKRDNSNVEKVDLNKLAQLETEIRQNEESINDPSCQTILFWSGYINNDVDAVLNALKNIKTLHDKGLYANNNINRVNSISMYQEVVDYMQSSDSQEGTGGF